MLYVTKCWAIKKQHIHKMSVAKDAFVLGENDSGNHFPPNPHVWLQRKISFSRNSFPVDQYLLFDPEIILHSYFQFKSFPEKEREREKREPKSERERGRRESR